VASGPRHAIVAIVAEILEILRKIWRNLANDRPSDPLVEIYRNFYFLAPRITVRILVECLVIAIDVFIEQIFKLYHHPPSATSHYLSPG